MAPAYAVGGPDVSLWKKHGGSVFQTSDPSGRIRRTFITPSGEKFRSWKECLKYMGSVADNDSVGIIKAEEMKASKVCLKEEQTELSKCSKAEKIPECKTEAEVSEKVSVCKKTQEMILDGKHGDEKPKGRASKMPVENGESHSKNKTCSKEIEANGKSEKKDETLAQNGKSDKRKAASKEKEDSGKSGEENGMPLQNGDSDKRKTPSKEKGQSGKSEETNGTSVQNEESDKKKPPLSTKLSGKSGKKDETPVPCGKDENGSDPTVALPNSSRKRTGSQNEKKNQIVDKRPRQTSSSLGENTSNNDGGGDDDQDLAEKSQIAENVKNESDESERRRPKRAAASTCFKEKRLKLDEKDAILETKPRKVAQGEEVAIVLTAGKVYEPEQPPKRRLLDFVVHDEDGKAAAIEMVGMVPLYITGLILPNSGDVDKESGILCEGIPIEAWDISGYEEGQAEVWLTSDMAEYLCVKPSGSYKRMYEQIFEKALVCVEIYKLLSKPDGGDPELGFEDLFAKLSRTFRTKGFQFFSKDYFVSKGSFIVSQLEALDKDADSKDQLFSGLPALTALDKECKSRDSVLSVLNGTTKGTSIKIKDEGSSAPESKDDISSDEKLARLLQEQEERKMAGRNRRNQQPNRGKYYIKINEDEIAMDYPNPAYYRAEEEEMDEYVLFDENSSLPEDLPRRMLHDWALYNCDSRFVSLELLPMLPGTEADVEVFGSGIMTDDDGGGYVLDDNSTSGVSSTNEQASHTGGIRIYLSSIKEWMIEFGASMLFISIRTDGAWYRLGQPSLQYSKWYAPVLKTSRIAIHIITMLKDAMRVSRLSFGDVIKRLAETDSTLPTYISSKVVDVERYIVVHGQIILQQFAEYPDETIKRSAFISGLASKMEERHHVKLVTNKKRLIKKGQNLNPRAGLRPDGTRPKPMRATTTKLINRIWSEFYSLKAVPDGEADAVEVEVAEQDEALEEGSDNDEETIVISSSKKKSGVKQMKSSVEKKQSSTIYWVGKPVGKTTSQESVYEKAIVRSEEVSVGGVVFLDTEDQNEEAEMILVEYMYEKKNGSKWIHGRCFERGQQTVLGDAANPLAVFLTDRCAEIELADIKGSTIVHMVRRGWNHTSRKANAEEDEFMREKAKERKEKGLPPEYYCRALYSPDKGSFSSIPYDKLALGTGSCYGCQIQAEYDAKMSLKVENDDYVRFRGIEHHIKDFFYVSPDVFPSLDSENEPVEKFKSSRNRGLRAFVVCQLLSIKVKKNSAKHLLPKDVLLSVRRFFRPEDISPEKAYNADIRELYYSEMTAEVTLDTVCGKCEVLSQSSIEDVSVYESFNNVFFCSCIFDPKKGTIKQLPANIKLSSLQSSVNKGKSIVDEVAIAKRKGKAIETEDPVEIQAPKVRPSLSSLDIFAGCGGLSEGLHQSGAAMTKWAIEYEHPAAEAFKLNHPEADVFCENCNVILRSIMEKGGDLEDCISTPEAEELSLKFSDEQKAKLPKPGEVDLIVGGPPCQGFSGMNRFNQSTWSKVQCEMILSFLSFADYFRPRYFLLENVRNFVSFNKGQTFRLALASLLEMGYQVRFGVLQAGNYGVSQSRKRAFIWAASPEDTLPEWPEPRHVFASSQLDIVLPGNLQYSAVRNAATGAPFRPITVRDTIADLPPVGNGADKTEISYGEPPQSWFQKFIRGQEKQLYDHIAKEMNELNYIRCQRIPKRPGADWRDLPEEKIKLSTGQLVDLIPWCLPNTAERHNQWKGLFGRLDWEGNFPTSVTDPQPMGKVGMCFHPEQDRIVTVRECARSQGFPDSYKFFGNIQSKHRQIGNAVPPPLARALGEKLKAAAECSRQASC